MLPIAGKQAVIIRARPGTNPARQMLVEWMYKNNKKSNVHQQRDADLWAIFGESNTEIPAALPSAAGFKPVVSPVSLTNPTKHQVVITIKGVGQERFVKAQIFYLINGDRLVHDMDVQIIRSAIPGYDIGGKPYKVRCRVLSLFNIKKNTTKLKAQAQFALYCDKPHFVYYKSNIQP
jgi:hypothetical protein